MTSRKAVLLATLAVLTMTTSNSIWGQASNASSDTSQAQEDSSKESETQANAKPTDLSTAQTVQPIDNSQIKVGQKGQRLPLSRSYRSYVYKYRPGRAYYPYSAHQNYFGGGLQGGYNLGSSWVNPNFGNHGSFNSSYNLGPIRINPNFGNSW